LNAPRRVALLALPSPDGNCVIANRAYQAQSLGLVPIEKSQKRRLQRRGRIESVIISQAVFLHEVIVISAETISAILRLFKEGPSTKSTRSAQMPNESPAVGENFAPKQMQTFPVGEFLPEVDAAQLCAEGH
jgi:hypothetical protein